MPLKERWIMYRGGTIVEKGWYWNPMDGQQVNVRRHGILPGDEGRRYMKISPACLLAIAPLFGMMFILFLPFFGIGVFLILWLVPMIGTLATVAVTGARVCCGAAVRGVSFNFRPAMAHAYSIRQKANAKVAFGSRDAQVREIYAYLA
jgi:hypothetical protein